MSTQLALVITDGGVGGLVACWAEGMVRPEAEASEGSGGMGGTETRSVSWLAPLPLPARGRRREAALRHVELCGLASCIEHPVAALEALLGSTASAMPDEVRLDDVVGGPAATRLLMAAAEDAVRMGIARIVWPVHLGDGAERGETDAEALERIAGVFERALLVGQLASIDLAESLRDEGLRGVARAITIETPYLDLTDEQLLELAIDMDAPVSEGWVCEREGSGGSGKRGGVGAGCGSCASCVRWRRALAAVDPGGAVVTVVGGGVRAKS